MRRRQVRDERRNVGKPDPTMLEMIVDRIGLDVADCVMTGDRLYTEIRMALDADMVSAFFNPDGEDNRREASSRVRGG